jgi:DNA-binding MarR family transcriptional regulator
MARQRRLATDAEIKALGSPVRMRILRVCLHESHTNKEIAEAIGRDPASTLHHVRRLVDTGFLVPQPVRRGTRGAREIPYLATGKSWEISVPTKSRTLLETFLEEIESVSATELDTARLGLRLPEEQMEEFRERLGELFDEFAAREDDPTAKPWSVFFAIHPDRAREKANSLSRRATGQR